MHYTKWSVSVMLKGKSFDISVAFILINYYYMYFLKRKFSFHHYDKYSEMLFTAAGTLPDYAGSRCVFQVPSVVNKKFANHSQ